MNIIQQIIQVQEFLDRVKSSRFEDDQYIRAINNAMLDFIEDRLGNKNSRNYFQQDQAIRDDLYTIIAPIATGTIVGKQVAYPADYYRLLGIETTVDGIVCRARPTEYNSRTEEDPHRKSKPSKTYYIENATGFEILCGTGTLTNCEIEYVKNWDKVSIGKQSDKIVAGGTLTNAVNYVVYIDDYAVYSGVTYSPGDVIAGTGAALTSGTVIPVSVTKDCVLFEKTHVEISRLAATFLLDGIEDFQKAQAMNLENKKR